MRRVLFLAAMLCLTTGLARAQGISVVGHTTSSNGNAGSSVSTTTNCTTCGATLNVPQGAAILAGVRYNSAASVSSVTDTGGDTFQLFPSTDSGNTGNRTAIYYTCNAAANASDAFSLALSGSISQNKNITIDVVSGALPALCPDGNGSALNGNSAAPATGNLTTAGPNEYLFSYFFCGGGGEMVGSSFTLLDDETGIGVLSEERGQGGGLASGTYQGKGVCTSGNWAISAALLLPQPGASSKQKVLSMQQEGETWTQ